MSDAEHEVCFSLRCFSCGDTTHVVANRQPEFGFEVVQAAEAIGMLGIFDLNYNRALVFCDKECADQQRKKDGSFRFRPKKVKAREVQS